MPSVRVKFAGPLRASAGLPAADVELPGDGATVGDVLRLLGRLHPALDPVLAQWGVSPTPHLRVFLNGQGIQFQGGLSARLTEGDELLLLLPIGGGYSAG